MLDSSTLYLILAMAGFVFVAIVMVHHHNCSDTVRRKRNEVKSVSTQLQMKIDVLEQEVVDIQMRLDEIDEEIEVLKG